MSKLDNVIPLRGAGIKAFYPGQPVECADPDIFADTGRTYMTTGTVHSIGENCIYIRLVGEPEAARRFNPLQVTPT